MVRPSDRVHAEHREVGAGHEMSFRRRLEAAVDAHVDARRGVRGNVREHGVRRPQPPEFLVAMAVVRKRAERRLISGDEHEARGILDRQRTEQHRVDQREDRGIRTDAETQRQNHDGGKAGTLSQLSRAVL
jgi:hypothetical protein